eukprot:356365-Chlamydomonas_euryale.AAC.7
MATRSMNRLLGVAGAPRVQHPAFGLASGRARICRPAARLHQASRQTAVLKREWSMTKRAARAELRFELQSRNQGWSSALACCRRRQRRGLAQASACMGSQERSPQTPCRLMLLQCLQACGGNVWCHWQGPTCTSLDVTASLRKRALVCGVGRDQGLPVDMGAESKPEDNPDFDDLVLDDALYNELGLSADASCTRSAVTLFSNQADVLILMSAAGTGTEGMQAWSAGSCAQRARGAERADRGTAARSRRLQPGLWRRCCLWREDT